MTRIALLGGSFNPPHVAHQMACLWVLSTEQADQVWLVPCFRHPFHKPLAPFEHRFQMCTLAAQDLPPGRVLVSRIEEELAGESRTLITIQHLRQRHPEHAFRLVIGSDILPERSAWYGFEQIEELAPPLIVGRSGYPSPKELPELPAVSSSRIRQMLDRGEDVSPLLPAGVLRYVQAHQLYAAAQ